MYVVFAAKTMPSWLTLHTRKTKLFISHSDRRSPMRKAVSSALTALMLLAVLMSPRLQADEKKPAPPPPKLKVGDPAPDFKLQYFTGNDGTILEEQIDSEAIDPTKIVAACERHKLKN